MAKCDVYMVSQSVENSASSRSRLSTRLRGTVYTGANMVLTLHSTLRRRMGLTQEIGAGVPQTFFSILERSEHAL